MVGVLASEVKSTLVRYPCSAGHFFKSTQLAGTDTGRQGGLGNVRQQRRGDEHRHQAQRKVRSLTSHSRTTFYHFCVCRYRSLQRTIHFFKRIVDYRNLKCNTALLFFSFFMFVSFTSYQNNSYSQNF